MADLLITVEIPILGGQAGDQVVNNFALHKEGDYVPGEATTLMSTLEGFYNTVPPGGLVTVASYLAAHLDRGADMSMMRVYDITGKLGNRGPDPITGKERGPAPHGSPIAEQTWALGAIGDNTSLPAQVAGVLTLRARNAWNFPVEGPDTGDLDTLPERPRARRTGRLYLGPLTRPACTTTANAPSRLHANFLDHVLRAAEWLQDFWTADEYAWCVWSRQNAQMSVIERVEMDNSPDVIRSRKTTSTDRQIRTFAPVPDLALGA